MGNQYKIFHSSLMKNYIIKICRSPERVTSYFELEPNTGNFIEKKLSLREAKKILKELKVNPYYSRNTKFYVQVV